MWVTEQRQRGREGAHKNQQTAFRQGLGSVRLVLLFNEILRVTNPYLLRLERPE